MNAVVKPKRCKAPGCREEFYPRNSLDAVCSVRCAIAFGQSEKIERHRKLARQIERREDRERIKTLAEYAAEAQREFNRWIRWRDRALPCICCGLWPRTPSNHQWDAGHYRTIGAAPQLRFNEDNAHKQLVSCNRGKSGNAVEYRLRLIVKIGLERVDDLESNNLIVRHTREDLVDIRREYSARNRAAKKAA